MKRLRLSSIVSLVSGISVFLIYISLSSETMRFDALWFLFVSIILYSLISNWLSLWKSVFIYDSIVMLGLIILVLSTNTTCIDTCSLTIILNRILYAFAGLILITILFDLYKGRFKFKL